MKQTSNQVIVGLDFWAKLIEMIQNIGVENVSPEGSQIYINEAVEQIIKTIQSAGDFKANTISLRGENNMVVEIVFKATTYESDYDSDGNPIDRSSKS